MPELRQTPGEDVYVQSVTITTSGPIEAGSDVDVEFVFANETATDYTAEYQFSVNDDTVTGFDTNVPGFDTSTETWTVSGNDGDLSERTVCAEVTGIS